MVMTQCAVERTGSVERLRAGEERRYGKRWKEKAELIGQISCWSPDGSVRHVRKGDYDRQAVSGRLWSALPWPDWPVRARSFSLARRHSCDCLRPRTIHKKLHAPAARACALSSMASSRIFVRNLPPTLSEADFRKHFAQRDAVTDAKLLGHRRIGYVGFKTPEAAEKAVKYFNKTFIRMSRIGVELARPVRPASRLRARFC